MVSVTIVTWNSAQYLDECFAALSLQDYRNFEVILVDNDSKDDTRKKLQAVEGKWRVIYNEHNEGFAEGQNQAIRASRGEYVLCLNPDVVLSPDFITQPGCPAAETLYRDAEIHGAANYWYAVGPDGEKQSPMLPQASRVLRHDFQGRAL